MPFAIQSPPSFPLFRDHPVSVQTQIPVTFFPWADVATRDASKENVPTGMGEACGYQRMLENHCSSLRIVLLLESCSVSVSAARQRTQEETNMKIKACTPALSYIIPM